MDFKWLSCRCWKHHYFKSLNKMLYKNLFDGRHFETDDYIILNFLHHTNYEYINIMNHTYVFFQYWLWNLIIVKTHTEIDQKPSKIGLGVIENLACLYLPNHFLKFDLVIFEIPIYMPLHFLNLFACWLLKIFYLFGGYLQNAVIHK